MENFIYVFGAKSRDRLIALQYELLKADEENHIYVFLNKDYQRFSCDDIKFTMSDTLTF